MSAVDRGASVRPQHFRQLRPLASEPSQRTTNSPYLIADEAFRYLRFASRRALYKAIEGGVVNAAGERIPCLRRGRTLLFDVRDLDRWLHSDTVKPLSLARKSKTVACKSVEGDGR